MNKTLPSTGARKRGILIVALAAAASTRSTGPGYKPLAPSHRRAASRVHRPDSASLSLIAIVVGGLMFAFGEGGSKKALAGIIFGLGMAMGAANFLAWLF